jgi:hypothetical protein
VEAGWNPNCNEFVPDEERLVRVEALIALAVFLIFNFSGFEGDVT